MRPEVLANSYDEVPYPSYPYPQTHPDHLATIATLLGLSPPRRPYRVLEIGCASAGNLIPMAFARRDCHFVGIDYSARQVEEGLRTAKHFQLDNLELCNRSATEVDRSLGEFDYIVCHGVYSWVSEEVQEKILDICTRQLSSNGIAYVSYNTQPGWRQRGALRDMMRYHVGRHAGIPPAEQIAGARQLLDFLVQATARSESAYARMLREQQEMLAHHSDSYLFHEHLEMHNEPLWFLDFCVRLEAHGLRYLGEADFGSMVASMSFDPAVQEKLDELAPDLLEKEQYTDFVRNRAFRQTLICHADQTPRYDVRGDRLTDLFAASPCSVEKLASDNAGVEQLQFTLPDGLSLRTPQPAAQAAMRRLAQAWPSRLSIRALVEELIDETIRRKAASVSPADIKRTIEVALLNAYASSNGRLVELSSSPLVFTADEIGFSKPEANRLVRYQAEHGSPVVNRRHDLIQLAPLDRRILRLLDGKHDVGQLVSRLVEQHERGELQIHDQDDMLIEDAQRIREILLELVPQRLRFLHRSSLLKPQASSLV